MLIVELWHCRRKPWKFCFSKVTFETNCIGRSNFEHPPVAGCVRLEVINVFNIRTNVKLKMRISRDGPYGSIKTENLLINWASAYQRQKKELAKMRAQLCHFWPAVRRSAINGSFPSLITYRLLSRNGNPHKWKRTLLISELHFLNHPDTNRSVWRKHTSFVRRSHKLPSSLPPQRM